MSGSSELASVEIRLEWAQGGIRHTNLEFFEKINFWRDIFPGSLAIHLPDSNGEWVSEEFPAGELVPPWSERNIHTVKRSKLKLDRKNAPPVKLHRGRHLPRYIAAGCADIFDGNMHPMRILDLNDNSVRIDLNHPLSGFPVKVSARILQRLGFSEERGGRCTEVVMEAMRGGIGLEALDGSKPPDFFSDKPFSRMDERSDSFFYRNARMVQHLDDTALEQVKAIYAQHLRPGTRVLDLMGSWDSHLPDGMEDLQVTGIGLCRDELERNTAIDNHIVQDLNEDPSLPFDDNSFDAVICTVSVEYLVRPVEVMREVGRILSPGGKVIITFSDRWFPTKAIGLWINLHPHERLALVLEYFRRAECFGQPGTGTVRGLPRPRDDKYAGQSPFSDPVFAAWASSAG